jgi:hypothetical protein
MTWGLSMTLFCAYLTMKVRDAEDAARFALRRLQTMKNTKHLTDTPTWPCVLPCGKQCVY